MKNQKTQEKFFYQISAEEAVKRLKTDPKKGLTSAEVAKRLLKYGQNELREGKRQPYIFRFFAQFKDLLIIVLIVAAILSYYLGDYRGGTILLIIVFVNAVIGFYQEYKAEKILERLKNIIKAKAVVIRGGKEIQIQQHEIVPGDLVYLEEGEAIPADIRLISSEGFFTNDFILTGESLPQEKFADLVIKKTTTLTNQDNSVFMGVTVAKGNAYGVVYATGMETAIGRIAHTSETITRNISPLQKEMNAVAKTLTKIAGIIALVIFAINFILKAGSGENMKTIIQLSFLFAIGVAAACVPQGLPTQVSVALSLGVGRMAEKKAIVKKLSSVETLGSTTVICSDKTGTLTKNEMTITHCYFWGRVLDITGDGYDPKGAITEKGKKLKKEDLKNFKQLFEDGFLASNGRVESPDKEHKSWYAIGDPTEAAFTPLAIKAGLDPDTLDKNFPIVQEIPFDSERKRMTIIRKHKGRLIAYMKGGLTSVLRSCAHINHEGKVIPLTGKIKKELENKSQGFASHSLRVLALAYRDFPASSKQFSIGESEKDFIFAGFVAMIDPPRIGVKEAVENAYKAGIRIMMITGDSPVTAKAISDRIGLRVDNGTMPVFTGDDIKLISDEKLKKILKSKSVIFSRVSPQDKYRLVTLLKGMGDVVAVTGDGVNDTLSLKKSDIGVAMGKMGSEVAKEASEMVLLDDNFHTLVIAIKEGRTIFQNLRKTILANIAANNAELTCVLLGFIGVAMGFPIPITAVQILAIDMAGEILPLTALTFDPGEKEIMEKPPRDLNEHVINLKSFLRVLFYGFWMGLAGFFTFMMIYRFGGGSLESARAGTYFTIIICQFINILSSRSEKTIFTGYLFTNPQLWGAMLISILLITGFIYIPVIAIWFGFGAISAHDLIYPAIGAGTLLFWHEVRKIIKLWRS
jgi:P-type Ca2+ transporter type 2C